MTPFDPDAPGNGDGIFGLPFTPEESALVLIPVPWDATTSYGQGTARGPAAMLHASQQVDLFDRDTGRPYEHGIAMLPIHEDIVRWNQEARAAVERILTLQGSEEGHVDVSQIFTGAEDNVEALTRRVNDLGRRLNDWVEAETRRWRARGKIVGIMGGDHSVPLGAIRATGKDHPGFGLLHIDAHADLRDAYMGFTYSHASIFNNVVREVPELARLVQVGVRDFGSAEAAMIEGSGGRIVTYYESDLQRRQFTGETWDRIATEIVEKLPKEVYLSVDIDGLDPALCPNTGTPVPGGLSFAQAIHLFHRVQSSGRRIVGFDLCEVAPGSDGSEWDANVGARVLYKLAGFSLLGLY